jgi:hypothetical protein
MVTLRCSSILRVGPQSIFLLVDLPVISRVGWKRRIFALNTEELPPFREIQIEVVGTKGNMVLRNLTLSAFVDTIEFSKEVILSGS